MKQKTCERKVIGAGIIEKRNDNITKSNFVKSWDKNKMKNSPWLKLSLLVEIECYALMTPF